MSTEYDRETTVLSWKDAFKRATDFDAWGQPVEAIDLYQRLSKQLSVYSDDHHVFSDSHKKTIEKIALCIESRRKALQLDTSHPLDGIALADLRKISGVFDTLLGSESSRGLSEFPLDVTLLSAQLRRLSAKNSMPSSGVGTLLPKPLPITGKTLLTIEIIKIDLKDASQYLDPFITVSVRDCHQTPLSASQDTPVATKKIEYEVYFHQNVHIQKTLESLPPGFAIFFEFKHFKPKKGIISTKCWAFMEQDEIKEGQLALEIYRKPTDFSRKALQLLSVKPHFLHLQLKLFK